ncbi:RtcB family protein [Aquihabitans sp. G128]|uniref:RtcB family protein n=1 Tax=Aquihabitans sp. G128 TaxID=2849779 RepID=UPI001C23C30A|nr:RtcB family protein [Aquihabitans sp. G128]QXC62601.1 RtcB family protein [Aquihabitans sp. G128]
MAPQKITDRLWSWASDLDATTRQQAERTSRLPILAGHVALMADAHLGLGATVGSVVPTEGAIIPACVGVDIGCGMAAVRTDLVAADLPDDLGPMLVEVERAIPAGMGRGHTGRHADARAERRSKAAAAWLRDHRPRTELDHKRSRTALDQLGTLGSGNHFVEVCLDGDDTVWVVLHSGSRGIGNQLAQGHIATARKVAKRLEIGLEDPDLAYLLEGSPEFDHYVADLLWAQDYAARNRELMLDALLAVVFAQVGKGRKRELVNCHHNYSAREVHEGREVWVTRKGAIRAGEGDLGIIPGSMGTSSFIVEGLGNPGSYESCSHGAGRRMSRTKARKELSPESLATAMGDRTWLADRAAKLVDEHPSAYKDIGRVMRDQADLVAVRHELRQVLNYKG